MLNEAQARGVFNVSKAHRIATTCLDLIGMMELSRPGLIIKWSLVMELSVFFVCLFVRQNSHISLDYK